MRPYTATPDQIARFRRERDAFGLRFQCPDCAHARTRADGHVFCTLGYPNETLMNADGFLDGGPSRHGPGQFVFCKYFELL